MKCENCGKYEARTRDYRNIDGISQKVFHCNWCYQLNDTTLYQIRAENLDPISFYDSIDYENLSNEELEELHDIAYNVIFEQIEDFDILDRLLEYERILTLKEKRGK